MSNSTYPDAQWQTITPEQAGFHSAKLEKARSWQEEKCGDSPFRFVIVRHGRLVLEWNRGMALDEKPRIASAAKSLYACVLGSVIADAKISSADEPVIDTYPELMDVPDGEGPKPGRHAFEKDRHITFRQLICNTSGYMKPGEEPGKVFHYQTYGMNILTHSLARLYGYYDVEDPEGSPGFKMLVEEKLANPIGAHFDYSLANFDLQEKARVPIFGYYCQVHTTPRDAARLGWLWCNRGRWEQEQVVSETWMREIVAVAPDILANSPEKDWVYGHGFWTNERGVLWPGLPRDGFSACGAGGHFITVFPSLELVIVQNPGYFGGPGGRANPELLEIVLNSLA